MNILRKLTTSVDIDTYNKLIVQLNDQNKEIHNMKLLVQHLLNEKEQMQNHLQNVQEMEITVQQLLIDKDDLLKQIEYLNQKILDLSPMPPEPMPPPYTIN